MSKIGEAMAKNAPAGGGEAPKTPEEQGPEVKDAEFKEKPPEGEAPKA
jgi:hypothetical protein